jgi:hypothetical protein
MISPLAEKGFSDSASVPKTKGHERRAKMDLINTGEKL